VFDVSLRGSLEICLGG